MKYQIIQDRQTLKWNVYAGAILLATYASVQEAIAHLNQLKQAS